MRKNGSVHAAQLAAISVAAGLHAFADTDTAVGRFMVLADFAITTAVILALIRASTEGPLKNRRRVVTGIAVVSLVLFAGATALLMLYDKARRLAAFTAALAAISYITKGATIAYIVEITSTARLIGKENIPPKPREPPSASAPAPAPPRQLPQTPLPHSVAASGSAGEARGMDDGAHLNPIQRFKAIGTSMKSHWRDTRNARTISQWLNALSDAVIKQPPNIKQQSNQQDPSELFLQLKNLNQSIFENLSVQINTVKTCDDPNTEQHTETERQHMVILTPQTSGTLQEVINQVQQTQGTGWNRCTGNQKAFKEEISFSPQGHMVFMSVFDYRHSESFITSEPWNTVKFGKDETVWHPVAWIAHQGSGKGNESRGHYFIYIRPPQDDNNLEHKMYKIDDSTVTLIPNLDIPGEERLFSVLVCKDLRTYFTTWMSRFEGRRSEKVPKGLPNIRSNCYAIVIMQMLMLTDVFDKLQDVS